MTDIERFHWLAQHPTAAAGIASQFCDQTLLQQHWNDTPEKRLEHFRKVIDYTIRYI